MRIPLQKGVTKQDIECDFEMNSLRVRIAGKDNQEATEISGKLKGRALVDDCYWVIEDEGGTRELLVWIAKKGEFVKWDGVLRADQDGVVNVNHIELEKPDMNSPYMKDLLGDIVYHNEGFEDED